LAVEIGPRRVLKNLIKRNSYNITTYSYDSRNDIQILSKTLNQLILRKSIITKCLGAANSTKNLNWDNDEYYEGVIRPYNELQKIYDKYRISKGSPIYEDMKSAVELIKIIFNTQKYL
jgi:[acyl-carrier-protein] S-malonyltransferase